MLHAVLLLVLFLSPAREYLLGESKEAKQAQVTASVERIEQISEHIDARQRETFEARLLELEAIQEAMEQIKQAKLAQYDLLENALVEAAPEAADTAIDEVLAAMQSVLDASDSVSAVSEDAAAPATAHEPIDAVESKMNQVGAQLSTVAAEQRRVREAQQRLNQHIDFLHAPEIAALQDEAEQAQRASERAFEQWISKSRESEAKLSHISRQLNDVARKQQDVEKQQKQVDQRARVVEQATKDLAPAEGALANASGKDIKTKQRQLKQSQDRLKRAERELQQQVDRQKRLEADVAQRQDKIDVALAENAESRAQAVNDLEAGVVAQAQAMAAQKSVKAALETLDVEAIQLSASLAAELLSGQPEPQSLMAEPSELPLDALLSTGRDLETNIAEAYRIIHSVNEATVRKISLKQALGMIQGTLPERDMIDSARLQSSARTSEAITARKEVLRQTGDQLKHMVMTTNDLLTRVSATGAIDEGMDIDMDWLDSEAAKHAAMEQLAIEEGGARAKDLSGAMRSGSGGASSGASASVAKGGDETLSASSVGGGRASTPSELSREMVAQLPGRRITQGNVEAFSSGQWLFVDSWYCIGPFPNPGRRDIKTRYPPETNINLDARYTGDQGKVVRWEFIQSSDVMVRPPNDQSYVIYYYFTELWFDEPMDLWIAVGSDDNSRVWVNDYLVWLSGYELKSWNISEGFRKVHFKQGLNQVLVRVENGHGPSGFSLAIQLQATE